MSAPNFIESIQDLIDGKIAAIHTALPGEIISFDGVRASVKPLIKRVTIEGKILVLPSIACVPVMFPRTNDFVMQFPIKKGDPVLLLFSSLSLGNWLATGNDSLPETSETHALNDAIAIPGLTSFSAPQITDKNIKDFAIKFKNQEIRIDADGNVSIGKGSVQKLVTESYKDNLDSILSALRTFMNKVSTEPIATVTAAAAVQFTTSTSLLFPPPSDSLTSKTKAQ